LLSNSSSSQFYSSGSNQIVNGGQHLKELNYITTEYVKDKNLVDERQRKAVAYQQHQQQHHHQATSADRNAMFNVGRNASLSNVRYDPVHTQQQQHQHRNNTNNINFSDNKSNDRYKSNLKSIKHHTTSSSSSLPSRRENKREVRDGGGYRTSSSSSVNETKHVNFNKRTSVAQKNQYPTDPAVATSYLRSSSSSSLQASVSKYHHVPSAISSHSSYNNHNANINSNNNPYANTVMTESVEQPTLMELECIAGYDGGLPQYFFLEAYDSRTRKLRLNITSALNDVPLFRIDLAGTFCQQRDTRSSPALP
jgi:hypothetical protein